MELPGRGLHAVALAALKIQHHAFSLLFIELLGVEHGLQIPFVTRYIRVVTAHVPVRTLERLTPPIEFLGAFICTDSLKNRGRWAIFLGVQVKTF